MVQIAENRQLQPKSPSHIYSQSFKVVWQIVRTNLMLPFFSTFCPTSWRVHMFVLSVFLTDQYDGREVTA